MNGLEDKNNKETQGRQLKKHRTRGLNKETNPHSLTQDLDLAGVNPDLAKDRKKLFEFFYREGSESLSNFCKGSESLLTC